MIDNKLNEAQEQFHMANKILSDEYGIGGQKNMETKPTEETLVVNEEPDNSNNIAKQDKRISQIREIALGGLQDYSHNVDSEQYQFYKKIWLMCDKAVSEKDTVSGENNN